MLGGLLPPKHVTIVSYEMSKRIPEVIYRKQKFVILDESHKVKSPKAQQTLHLAAVVKQAEHAVLMTGTPIQGKSTIDYFSQVIYECSEGATLGDESVFMPLLSPSILMSFATCLKFRRRYSSLPLEAHSIIHKLVNCLQHFYNNTSSSVKSKS